MYYDRQGNQITSNEWAKLFSPEYKRVALDDCGEYVVSTVWTGLDGGFWDGPPLIFETMVFESSEWNNPNRDGLTDLWGMRHATEEGAKDTHQTVAAALSEGAHLDQLDAILDRINKHLGDE